jgi:hypothetical protein
MTVQLRNPLDAGNYVFFADPMGVGLAVKERAHLDGSERGVAAEALERAFVVRMKQRIEGAFLVALGTEGEFRPLFPPSKGLGRVPWAIARFGLERVLKGRETQPEVTLVGPVPASKRLPRAPALRPGRRAILILQRPPVDALEHLPADERQAAAFIADVLDIVPPERIDTIVHIIEGMAVFGTTEVTTSARVATLTFQ